MASSFAFEKDGTPVNSLTLMAADFDAEGKWYSDEYTVGNFDACQSTVFYEDLDPQFQTPSGNQTIAFDIFSQLQTEIGGRWQNAVAQQAPFDSTFADPVVRILSADPNAVVIETGGIFDGSDTQIVTNRTHIGDKVRICIQRADLDNGGLPFVSLTVSLTGLLY